MLPRPGCIVRSARRRRTFPQARPHRRLFTVGVVRQWS